MPANESLTHGEATSEQPQEEAISRRRLLKAILATGGAVAASALLPGKWSKPVVEIGVLPAHAQITEPVVYAIYCDSDPEGGGDIILEDGEGVVQNITATVKLLSGAGPVAGIDVTMSAVAASGYDLPDSFSDLPRVRTTNASGVASFGDLVFYGQDGDAFNLQFDYLDPVNNTPDNCICGRYDLVELPE